MSVLVSLMCHPDNEPKVSVEGAVLNRTPGYGDAIRSAITQALDQGKDLVVADSDGYHPKAEVEKLASLTFTGDHGLVKPYRTNMGFQSEAYAWAYSFLKGRWVGDPTGGLYRMSFGFMGSLRTLEAKDSTITVEVVNRALSEGTDILQYGYQAGENDREHSKRPSLYPLKLLKAMA